MGKAILGVSLVILATALTLPVFAAPAAAKQKSAREAFGKGESCLEKFDLDSALAAFNEAIRLDPKFADAYCERGVVHGYYACVDDINRRSAARKRENERAIADFNEAIRLDPKSAVAFRNRGEINRVKGDLDEAIADFTEAIRLDPKHAKAYAGRGCAYKDIGELDRAISDLTETIRLCPKDNETAADARDTLAEFYVLNGDREKARAAHTEAVRLNPGRYNTIYNRPHDLGKAIEAVRLNPKER